MLLLQNRVSGICFYLADLDLATCFSFQEEEVSFSSSTLLLSHTHPVQGCVVMEC